jgi:hypothetical protein
MIFWNVAAIERLAAARGWTNPHRLSVGAGIGYPAAWALTQGGAIGRLDTRTWEALADAFGVELCDLIERVR